MLITPHPSTPTSSSSLHPIDFNLTTSITSTSRDKLISPFHNTIKPNPDTSQTLKTDRNILREKKKNYANAIRQKNNLIYSKKKSNQTIFKHSSQYQIKNVHSFIDGKLNQDNHNNQNYSQEQCSSNNNNQYYQCINSGICKKKSVGYLNTNYNEPISSTLKINNQQQMIPNTKIRKLISPRKNKQVQIIHKKKYLLCSNQVNQTICNYDCNVNLVIKENQCLKSDLYLIQNDNAILRKQLETRIAYQTQNRKKSQQINEQQLKQINTDNSIQIILKLKQEILQIKKQNSTLELKTYMAQKKVISQINIYKKKMAKQLGQWRDKYNKVIKENIKLKSNKDIKDINISMNISKDSF